MVSGPGQKALERLPYLPLKRVTGHRSDRLAGLREPTHQHDPDLHQGSASCEAVLLGHDVGA